MNADEIERRSASSFEPMRCMRCDCTFKRLEHLKRHERIHDTNKRFACSHCSKLFTRSDILRRHEATHAAVEQVNGPRSTRSRACTECARSRERCTKNDPCQRCSTKGLRCIYPHERANARNQHLLSNEPLATTSAQSLSILAEVEPPDIQNIYRPCSSSETEMITFGTTGSIAPNHHGSQVLQPMVDFPMNWLPPDNSIAIDYDSIVGFGMSSLDFFSLPSPSPDVTALAATMQHGRAEQDSLVIANLQTNTLTQHDLRPSSVGQPSPSWNMASPETVESHVSSDSSYSATRTISPSAALGGLYATSINGARMSCTVRVRRPSRLLPGATLIRPVCDTRYAIQKNHDTLEFPDTSHISIEHTAFPIDPNLHSIPTLTNTIHEEMQRNFGKLCLGESIVFSAYTSTRFLDLPTLNMFIRLYFENFDAIIPVLHDQVTRMNDHWLLALAVCAIGCQYAEADEFSQSVEPLHEFLQRAITVEFTNQNFLILGENPHDIALAQAMTLNQIGMLYFGSPRLLRLARAQHSTLIEIARSLSFPLPIPSSNPTGFRFSVDCNPQDLAWRRLLFEECKRRIGHTIWLLDCMAVYHFSQQPLMPTDLSPIVLPNDKLWSTRSSEEWNMQSALAHGTSSLSSAVVSLFCEKQVMMDLSQFSRILLLHGVYRQIFNLKDCFANPLGNWIPSIQQAEAEHNDPKSPSNPDAGGRTILNSWRNAALDCVDVLHWAANGTIALQAGAEHPTVLHLHLSRTVLLAPLDRIQTLVDSILLFSQSSSFRTLDAPSRKQSIDSERDVLEWAQRDQCKARLAVLHSGCLFWHIRRYSCRAFYEPISVFLATLTIWAYSSYASRTGGPSQNMPQRSNGNTQEGSFIPHSFDTASSPPSDDPELGPTFIHLDRPNDDEMVQAFVRFGTSTIMRANITGVGNIYSPKGPTRVLKEGRKILAAVSTAWGRTEKFVSILEALEKVASAREP